MQTLRITTGETPLDMYSTMANRHGLISGATGTGKTVTLQVMAEEFSRIGVPVFMADVKGDLSGISMPGQMTDKLRSRLDKFGINDLAFQGYPTEFWDIYGALGLPARTTISEMGPLLLSRILNLNDTQSSVLTLIFKIADDNGLLLLDLKDLRSIVQFAGDNSRQLTTQYGNISAASIGAIQRALVEIETSGAGQFFGEPALNLDDLIQTGPGGLGVINILAAENLIQQPKLYSMFLLWMLSELFERMPEAGDLEKPKLVFFFDEAHLLFSDAPAILQSKIEQVVRLIRSKGVGVYFITQSPMDIPDTILGQLGNRVQHCLRAFTPKDQKLVKSAAATFRQNPAIDAETAISQLGVGEALVSFLDEQGIPTPVVRTWIMPPHSKIGPIDTIQRQNHLSMSSLRSYYSKTIDRESAFEVLKARAEKLAQQSIFTAPSPIPQQPAGRQPAGRQPQTVMDAFVKSTARTVGNQLGRQLIRGILGSLFGGRR